MTGRGRDRVPVWLLAVSGVVLGLVAFGAAGVVGWLLYRDADPVDHMIPLVVLAVLSIVAGLTGERALEWLLRDVRRRP